MEKPGYWRARVLGFRYAFRGIVLLLRYTPHARIHLLATFAVVVAGIVFEISTAEWATVMVAAGMVWSSEAMNTALEKLTDLASPDIHPLAGMAKDLAAGAVLLASIFALAVAAFVFIPKIIA